jgi:hypothetical protein
MIIFINIDKIIFINTTVIDRSICYTVWCSDLSDVMLYSTRCTVRKKDLILRSIECRPQMQFSMARKFPLWRLRIYSVKRSKMRNFTFDTL